MKYFTLAVAFICATVSHAQTQGSPAQKLYNSILKWTIVKPEGFDTLSREKLQQLKERGAKAIEDATEEKIDNVTHPLIAYSDGKNNTFESNYQTISKENVTNYQQFHRQGLNIIYKTLEDQVGSKGATLDSSSRKVTISGLTFDVFSTVATFPNKMVMHIEFYAHVFGNKELTISVVTLSREAEEKLLSALKSSVFE